MKEVIWERIKTAWEATLDVLDEVSDFIARLFEYAPVLWKDRDYDHHHILTLLKYKLGRTRSHIVRHQIIADADKVGEQIAHAEELLRRILADDYCKEEQEAHEVKWGEWVDLSKPSTTHPGYWEWHMSRANAIALGLETQEKEEQRAIYERMELAKKLDMDELFIHIRQHIESWWD